MGRCSDLASDERHPPKKGLKRKLLKYKELALPSYMYPIVPYPRENSCCQGLPLDTRWFPLRVLPWAHDEYPEDKLLKVTLACRSKRIPSGIIDTQHRLLSPAVRNLTILLGLCNFIRYYLYKIPSLFYVHQHGVMLPARSLLPCSHCFHIECNVWSSVMNCEEVHYSTIAKNLSMLTFKVISGPVHTTFSTYHCRWPLIFGVPTKRDVSFPRTLLRHTLLLPFDWPNHFWDCCYISSDPTEISYALGATTSNGVYLP